MNTTGIIFTVLGCVIAAVAITIIVAIIIYKSKLAIALSEHEKLYQQYADQAIEEKDEQLKYLNEALSKKEQEIATQKVLMDEKELSHMRLARETKENYERTIADLRDNQAKQISELKESQEKQLKAITDKMTVETEKILRQREEELKKDNKNGIDEILSPLKDSIKEMKEAMTKNAEAHIQKNTELSKQLEQAVKEMKEKTNDIGSKAEELATALSAKPKVQGCFGESFLEDILSQEGLENGKHYSRELANDDHSRPDFVFHFKEGLEQKDLIVDSKVSLTAFVKYMNAEDDATRKAALSEHLLSVHKHIDELVKKEYAKKVDDRKRFADYVLMFMPYDAAYRIAIDEEPMLWQEAYNRGVLITTEQTIVPFLKIMKLTWNKYQHDANMAELEKAATNMIDRVGAFYDSYKDLGKKLNAVCREYNSGVVKLQDNGHSITTAAQQVIKLGVKRSKGKEMEVPVTKVLLDGGEEVLIDFGSMDEY